MLLAVHRGLDVEQHQVVEAAVEGGHDAPEPLDGRGVGEERDHDAEGLAATPRQPLGERVGPEVQRRHGLQHPCAGARADLRAAVQDPGDGPGTHAGSCCHVADGDHRTPPRKLVEGRLHRTTPVEPLPRRWVTLSRKGARCQWKRFHGPSTPPAAGTVGAHGRLLPTGRRFTPVRARRAPRPPRRGGAPAPTRAPQRPVDRAGLGAGRHARGHRRRERHAGSSCSPARAGRSARGSTSRTTASCPNIDGLQVGRIAQRSMRVLLPARAPPARACPSRSSPRSTARPTAAACAWRSAPTSASPASRPRSTPPASSTGSPRTEMGAVVAAPPPHRRGPRERPAAHRPGRRRRRGAAASGSCPGSCPTTSCSTPASRSPAAMCRVQPLRPRHDQGRPVGQPRDRSLEAAPSSSRTATS